MTANQITVTTGTPMTQARSAWMRGEVRKVLLRYEREKRLSCQPSTQRSREEAVCLAYRALWKLGYKIEKLESLAPRHLDALLQHWRDEKRRARSTCRSMWSHLKVWCSALGKAGMLPRFVDVWPDEVDVDGIGSPNQPEKRVVRLSSLGATDYERLLHRLGRKTDRTGYFLVRCIRELGLKCEEALLFDPATKSSLDGAVVLVHMRKGRGQRLVALDSDGKRALAEAVASYMRDHGKSRLGWRDQGLEEMRTRYRNLLSYAIRALNRQAFESDGAATPVQAEGSV